MVLSLEKPPNIMKAHDKNMHVYTHLHKVDLVMWAKNGSKILPLTLKRINDVIPEGFVNNRILVDDHSLDNTQEVAESFGWQVFFNEGKGICSGANTALRHVTSDFFISFEQDLLLARDWWQKIPRLLEDKKVAVASGVRVPNQPAALRRLQEYTLERYQRIDVKKTDFFHAKTLDNTIYKTEIIRKLGGFPWLPVSAGVDTFLAKNVVSAGFRWKVDYTVTSIHLRGDLKDELAHYYWYGACHRRTSHVLYDKTVDLTRNVLRFFFSPVRGLQIAFKKNAPEVVYIYPLIRLNILKGMMETNKAT